MLSTSIESMKLHAYIEDKEVKVELSGKSLWSDEYILPSRRLAYIQAIDIIPRIVREMKPEEKEILAPVLGSFLRPLLEKLPFFPPAPAFLDDLRRVAIGFEVEPIKGKLETIGRFIIRISPLLFVLDFLYKDPYTGLNLPLGLAPDGLVDASLINTVIQRSSKGSLVVIEEPDICKNPLAQVELTKFIAKGASEREVTIVMTTHSEVMPLALAKLVEERIISAKDVRIYYFERKPWTGVRLIEVYDDGTLGELPDSEETTIRLF